MKKLERVEKVLLILVVVALICAMGVGVQASGTGDVNDLLNNGEISDIPKYGNNAVQNQPTNNQVANTPRENLQVNKSTNNTTNTTSLPKTGVNDTAIWVLVAACGIAAVYTYKKVRDYNV